VTLSRLHLVRIFLFFGPLLFPAIALAQYPQPTWLVASPSTVYLPGFYTLCAGNGAYMTLDIQYTFSGGGGGPIYGWPSLGPDGCASVHAGDGTPPGTYTFTAAKNTLNPDWVSVFTYVTIAQTQDFSISAAPSMQTAAFGGSTAYAVSVIGQNGFSSPVSLTADGLPPGAFASFSANPINPGQSTTMTIFTSSSTVGGYGTFTVTVTGSGGGLSQSTSVQLTVDPPPQPTSMSISPAVSYAGNTPCASFTFINAANTFVDLQYTLQGYPAVGSIQLNSSGQWQYCPGHNDALGTFVYTAMKNHWRTDWTAVPSLTYTLNPPKPTSLSVSPSTVTSGIGSYTISAGNGGNVRLQLQYKFNEGSTITLGPWPDLDSSGNAVIPVGHCTEPGTHRYVAVKNSLNGDDTYLAASAPVDVISTPAITSISQSSAPRGWIGTVTISGSNLCGVSLSSSWPGLSFSNVTSNLASASATLTVDSTASVGTASITLNSTYGSTIFNFTVTNNAPPVISSITPSSSAPGTNPSVTVAGANLTGATLSTAFPGLTFSNINSDPQGATLAATFNIAAAAAPGTPTIQVINSVGTTGTSLFSIVAQQQQPASMSVSPAISYAGNTPCTTFTFGSSPNMLVDLQYSFQGNPSTGSIQLDAAGQWQYCPSHNDPVGTYIYTAMKSHALTDWVALSGITYTVNPPSPTSLSVSPTNVTAGAGSYTMTAGNGGDVRLQLQYKLNEGSTITLGPWPDLDSGGNAVIPVGDCTPPGTYRFVAVKNWLNGDDTYLAISAAVTVSSEPAIGSASPASVARASSVTISISGRNLCDVSFSTAAHGLTFTNTNSDGMSATATLTVAPTALIGVASISLNARYGSVGFSVAVIDSAVPLITSINPTTGTPGTNPTVTISGANLTGATLTTAFPGLTFSNINSDAQGATLAATFNIASNAPPGTPTIQVANSAGTTGTSLFSIISSEPQQPAAMTVSPAVSYAGNTPCATFTFSSSPNMLVDLQYTFQGNPSTGTIQLDAAGQWQYCPAHTDPVGTYTYTAMKNHARTDWVGLSGITYTVNPPSPTSLSVSPASVTAGAGSYTMTAGNGGDVRLQVQYKLNEGPTITLAPWPDLDSSGSAIIPVGHCTPPGTYRFVAVKNALNGNDTYLPVSALVTVTSTPAITLLSQSSAPRGWSGTVTMQGRNLCGVSLSTTFSGLSISNVSSNGNSASATFTVASNAAFGTATITLNASFGSTTFNFTIANNNTPVVTGMSPASGMRGSSVSVTLTGINLAGAALSTTWPGLTFTNVTSSSNGLSLTATFNIAATAQAGSPTIQVRTKQANTTTQLFSILAGPVLTREYIYLGGRLIAVESAQ
jgi:hypothetical protein